MGVSKLQPSRQRRAFNGWCHGLLQGIQFRKVLNLGCGHDRDRQGHSYSGYFDALEVVKVDIKEATNYPPNEECLCGGSHFKNPINLQCGAEELPFADGEFDLVFCNWVIYHTDYFKSIPEIKRVLQEGGHVYLSWNCDHGLDPIEKVIRDAFGVTATSYFEMDGVMDGHNYISKSIFGMKKYEIK